MNHKIARWFFYFLGLLILSLGIVLNTKSQFGVTPIISLAYCYSTIKHLNFGNTSFVLYCILAVIESSRAEISSSTTCCRFRCRSS